MKLKLNRQRLEAIYSLVLIIFIPAAIAIGAIWLTSQVQDNFDQELRRKANLGGGVFGVSVANILANNSPSQAQQLLQQLIDQTRSHAPEIAQLTVSTSQGSGFRVVASSDTSKTGKADTTLQTQLVWSKAVPIGSLVTGGESNSRQWRVSTPVTSNSGQLVAVATISVDLRSSDALMTATLTQTTIGLAVLLSVIIALLLHHFRFVQYAELFRQQRELDRMKDDFISIATHELKAPMSVIKGYISMALEDNQLPPSPREMIQTAYDQTGRLNNLVSDLLDVSRLEQGRTKYNLQSVDLAGVIKPITTVYQPKAQDKKLKLSYDPPTPLPAVQADPDRCSEIFTNLIDNAIKYSRTGAVTIAHTITPGTVITTVTDTGIGLTPEEQSHLFQRFYRARNADTQDIAGTGLGLWIIRQYAEAMGGSITLQSVKGQGSTFRVVLPAVKH